VVQLPVEQIILPDDHVRTDMDKAKLANLAASIDEVGLLQPVIVVEQENGYLLVAGVRRLLACKLLGVAEVPALILSNDAAVRQVQIIENIQREELNPIDRAMAIKLFIDEHNLSIVQVAEQLGVPRTTLNDWLSVLDIEERYQNALINNYYGGSSPLTISHITLAKRFAKKLGSDSMVNVVLDAVLDYGLTRTETKRVLELIDRNRDLSIEQAVRKVRHIPKSREGNNSESHEWSVEKLFDSLSKSGDYLVKTNVNALRSLQVKERRELLRRAKALQRLLSEVINAIDDQSTENIRQII